MTNLQLAQKEIQRLRSVVRKYEKRLRDGRHYLMGVEPNEITPEKSLEAFGWDRTGITVKEE